MLSPLVPAPAQSLRQDVAAINRQDYQRASQIFIPLAARDFNDRLLMARRT
jgi:hypothetical protein